MPLSPEEREAFAVTMRELDCHWIPNEAPGVLAAVDRRLGRDPGPGGGRRRRRR
ncbi:hypothetical protein ACFRFJ_41900 [Streptomyces hydrogenans]|uniref:hypothetical protein n=1 Tax=Streptomyces hydrogenans TaxID=1873719 RepID=UPI0036CFAA58